MKKGRERGRVEMRLGGGDERVTMCGDERVRARGVEMRFDVACAGRAVDVCGQRDVRWMCWTVGRAVCVRWA